MAPLSRVLIGISLLLGAACACAAESLVPVARDLRAEGAAARAHRVPLMLMFAADYCGWCARMEREFLEPMLRSGRYEDKVMIRKVTIDADRPIAGFDARPVTGSALAARYAVSVTPTLLFLDGEGNPVGEPLVGLTSPDYFGGELDGAIDSALARVRPALAEGDAGACRAC